MYTHTHTHTHTHTDTHTHTRPRTCAHAQTDTHLNLTLTPHILPGGGGDIFMSSWYIIKQGTSPFDLRLKLTEAIASLAAFELRLAVFV